MYKHFYLYKIEFILMNTILYPTFFLIKFIVIYYWSLPHDMLWF